MSKTFHVVTFVHDQYVLHATAMMPVYGQTTRIYVGCEGPAVELVDWLREKNWCQDARMELVDPHTLAERDEDEISRAARVMKLFANFRAAPRNY